MRYIITSSQLHSVVYKLLDNMFKDIEPKKEQNPSNKNAYRINFGKAKITYFYYGPGEYDDGTPHNGIGMIFINPDIVDTLRKTIKIRESKVVDLIADWFSEKFEVDIDEISIYPKRKNPPVY